MNRTPITRRQLLRSAAIGAGSLLVAACAPKVVEVEKVVKETVVQQQEVEKLVTAVPAAPAEPLTIKVWTTGGDTDAQMMMQAGELFKLSHPNVTVVAEPVSWTDGHTKILSAVTAQSGPDVITGGMSWGIELGKQGGMIDLKEGYPDIVGEIKQKTMPGIWGAIVPPSGEVYAVEWASTLEMAFYRSDLLKDICGLEEPPKTWDDLTAVLERLKTSGKTSPIIMQWGNLDWLGLFNFLYAAGGSYYDENCTKVTLNSPEGKTALKYFADFYLTYGAPTDGWPDGVPFEKGDSAVLITGNWMITDFELTKPELAGKWVASPLPVGPGRKRTSFIGGTVMGILSYVQPAVRDAAAQFIRFLYTPEAVKAEMNYAAAQKSMFIPPSTEFMDFMPVSDVNKKAISDTLADAFGPPNCKGWEESNSNVNTAIQEVVLNGADMEQALATAAAALEADLTQ